MALLPVGIDNTLMSWQARRHQIDVFVHDASGLSDDIAHNNAYFYAKKYPIVPNTDMDISIAATGIDVDRGKLEFDLSPLVTDLSAGDYLYEVVLESVYGDLRTTIVQDTFKLIHSIDKTYGMPFYSVEPLSYTFYPSDLSTALYILTTENNSWVVTPPSWMASTPTTSAGSRLINLEMDDAPLWPLRPFGQVSVVSPVGTYTIDVSFYKADFTITPDPISLTVNDTSKWVSLDSDADNSWIISSKPDWINVLPTSGIGDVSIVISTDGSLVSLDGDVIFDSSLSFPYTLDVSYVYSTALEFIPSSYEFTAADLSTYIDISTGDYNEWQITDYPSWISVDISSGTGDASILVTSAVETYQIGALTATSIYAVDNSIGLIYNDVNDFLFAFENNLDCALTDVSSFTKSGTGGWGYINGKDGSALRLDADSWIGNYDASLKEITYSDSHSVSFWLKTDVAPNTSWNIFNLNSNNQYKLWLTSGGVGSETATEINFAHSDSLLNAISFNINLDLTSWRFIAYTLDNSIFSFWIDGVFDSSALVTGYNSLVPNALPWSVHRYQSGADAIIIDQMRYFDKIITQNDVNYLWNGGTGI